MGRIVWLWLILLGCLASWSDGAAAATLSGRLTTSAYSWEEMGIDRSASRHVRVFQSVMLNARRLGGTPLSFHTYGYVSGDLSDEVDGRRRYRIYHAYLRWHSQGRSGLDLTLGRQRVHDGVGFGTIDGLRFQVVPRQEVKFSAYAGTLTPVVSEEGIGTWDEGHLWGGQILFDIRDTSVGVSFAERAREPIPYIRSGQYSGVRIQNGARQFRRLGADARREMGKGIELYGRLDLDAEAWEVHEVEVAGRVRATPKLRLSAEYRHRKPTLYLNSILSVFEASNDQEVGGRLSYQVSPQVAISVNGTRVIVEDDGSWRLGLGLTVPNGYVGYSRRIGYGGENDAVALALEHPLSAQLALRANGSVSSYRPFAEQRTRDRALAGSAGLTYRPRRGLSFDVEGQALHNTYYASDVRVFLRGSYWFFKRSQ